MKSSLWPIENLSGWTVELYTDTVPSEYLILFIVSFIMNTFTIKKYESVKMGCVRRGTSWG